MEEDGSLLLRGGVSGWLLDELVGRCAISPLNRALSVLSAAIEGARQADAGGEGCGAPPDVLRLACDALAQVLISMQAEEVEGAVADAQASSRASTEPVSGSLARRRGALALTAAASAAAGSRIGARSVC